MCKREREKKRERDRQTEVCGRCVVGEGGVIFLHQMFEALFDFCVESRPGPWKGVHGASPSLLQERIFLTLSNYVFTAVFLAEMTVKVTGMGIGLGPLVPWRQWN